MTCQTALEFRSDGYGKALTLVIQLWPRKKAGKLVFVDYQTQSIKNRDEFVADVKARPRYAFWAFRVDNRELDKEMIKLIMKESKR